LISSLYESMAVVNWRANEAAAKAQA